VFEKKRAGPELRYSFMIFKGELRNIK